MDHLKLLAHQELSMPGFGGKCWQFSTTGFLSRLHAPKIMLNRMDIPKRGASEVWGVTEVDSFIWKSYKVVNGETTAKPVILGSGIGVTLQDSVAGDFRGTQE